MIVRCTNCNSAFAVDDDKVENKKFAFTCPKCSTDNVIDNRQQDKNPPPSPAPAVLDETFSEKDTGGEHSSTDMQSIAEDDFESNELLNDTIDELENDPILNDTSSLLTDDLADDISSDLPAGDADLSAAPDTVDTGTSKAATDTESADIPMDDFNFDEEPAAFDNNSDTPAHSPEDFADLDLSDEPVLAEKTEGPAASTSEGLEEPDDLAEFDLDIDLPEEPVLPESAEEPDASVSEAPAESDDLADLDLDLDFIDKPDMAETEDGQSEISSGEAPKDEEPSDGLLTADDTIIQDELADFPEMDEDLNLDEPEGAELKSETEILDEFQPVDEDISLPALDDTGNKDEETAPEGDIKAEEIYPAENLDDESITIDLDSLDIELEDDDLEPSVSTAEDTDLATDELSLSDEIPQSEDALPEIDIPEPGPDKSGAEFSDQNEAVRDDDVTLDLDSLDIALEEDEGIREGEQPDELDLDLSDFEDEEKSSLPIEEPIEAPAASGGEDDDVTLDLDSLDISLEESDEIQEGESPEEDEKLTLEDAGLTIEELTSDEMDLAVDSENNEEIGEEEDIKLTIDEIDPGLNLDNIETELMDENAAPLTADGEKEDDDQLLVDEFDDLPEINFDDLEGSEEPVSSAITTSGVSDRELTDITEFEEDVEGTGDSAKRIPGIISGGRVSFSIDFSLKYSRLGAAARLFGLFFIGMLPHFLVFLLYSLVSLVLGIVNHIVVITTGQSVEDFSEFTANTLRYFLSISASASGIMEEMPIFAGRGNIDYPLQFNVIYPLHYSRLFGFLRLSIIGILLLVLPHILLIGLISFLVLILSIVGIVSVIITGRWPHLLFDILARYFRYNARVLAFTTGIVDDYPTFKF